MPETSNIHLTLAAILYLIVDSQLTRAQATGILKQPEKTLALSSNRQKNLSTI